MSHGLFLLMKYEEIAALPDSDSASEIAGDHPITRRVEPDNYRGGVRFPLLLGCLLALVPENDSTCMDRWIPLSRSIARMGFMGCHSMQVGVMGSKSHRCLLLLSIKRLILFEAILAIVG